MSTLREKIGLKINFWLLASAFAVWYLGFLFQRFLLHYNPLIPSHDAKFYFYSSERWEQMMEPFHVPLYPLLLRFFRWISADAFDALVYTQGLNLVLFLLSVQLFYRLCQKFDLKREGAYRMAMLFAVFLFSGFSYSLIPIADQLAIVAYLLFGLALFSSKIWQTALFASIAIMSHKILWPIIALSFLLKLIVVKKADKVKWLLASLMCLAPLVAYWAYGAEMHDDKSWLLSANLNKEIQRDGIWFPFSGLLDLFRSGEGADLLKSTSIVVLLIGAAAGISRLDRFGNKFLLGFPVFASLLLFALVLNDFELFVVIRYGKLLLICVLGWLRPDWLIAAFWWPLLFLLFLSNLFFLWHAAGSPALF